MSCSDKPENSIEDKQLLDNISETDTLTIRAQFSECGEWGGHTEVMKIFRTSNKILTLWYQKDTVDCLEQEFSQSLDDKIIEQWTKELSKKDQDAILKFMHDLLDRSFKDEGISNAADYYIVTHTRTDYMTIRY